MRRLTHPQRLCMIVHSSYPADPRVAREVRVALRAGYEVDVVAMREAGELPSEIVEGATVYRLPIAHRRGVGVLGLAAEYFGFAVLAALRVSSLMVRRRYCIVQVHNPPDFLIAAAFFPWLLGAHVILDIHDLSPDMFAMRFDGRPGAGFADRSLRRIERWATRFADAVITVHEPYRRELADRGVPRAKTAVVMNTLDDALVPPNRPDTDRGGFRIVYHGTVTPHYGIHLVVEAVAQLVSDVDDVRLEIYGEGDSLPEIRARSEQLGIVDRITLSGRYLPHAEVLGRVLAAHVGVVPNLPNRLNKFALSSKLFEYVALGVPVVCADLPTIREHFSDDEVLFFRAGDDRSLAQALHAVAGDPDAAAKRAGAALRRYAEQYSWQRNAERYAKVLEAISRCPGRRRNRRPG